MSNFEKWLESNLAFHKQAILDRISEIEHVTDRLKERVIENSYLNDLGEIQLSGIMLDTAVAAYATERRILENYRKMED